jgi:hypothetical protein
LDENMAIKASGQEVLPYWDLDSKGLSGRDEGESMPEIQVGDLSQADLLDILRPLLVEKKNGRVIFQGKESGEIYLEAGNMVHAITPQSEGEKAFFSIMEWKEGKVLFEPNASPDKRTISTPSAQLLMYWWKKESDKIRELIPSMNVVFSLCLQRDSECKTVSSDQWNVLALCNGIRTVSEVAKTLNWNESRVLRTFYQLIRAGVLQRGEAPKGPKKKLVGEHFFIKIEQELSKVMGPIAPIIIEDKLTEIGGTPESFPQDQALSFIESLSEEIPLDQKKREFVSAVMEFLSRGR